MTAQLKTYMNNGRWLMHCPKDSTPLPALEKGVVCPRCHPGMLAKALQPLNNGSFRIITDVETVQETVARARELGEIYFPIFSEEKLAIETILRLRPAAKYMNWIPGETLDDLRKQNIKRGDPVPQESD